MSVRRMLTWTNDTDHLSSEDRAKRLRSVAYYVDSWCSGVNTYRGGIFSVFREEYNRRCGLGFGRHYGNYLVTLALGIKFLYFFNAVGQLFILNEFLGGNDFYVYGYEVVYTLVFKGHWPASNRFPFRTLCDFQLRQLYNVQRWTLHCVLPINLFNEKFFVILWFWLSLVTIMSFANLVYASFLVWHGGQKVSFAKKYLYMCNMYDKNDFMSRKLLHKFCNKHLRQDGIFLLKMISRESGPVIVTDIIKELWEIYIERVRSVGKKHADDSSSDWTLYEAEYTSTDALYKTKSCDIIRQHAMSYPSETQV